PVSTTASPPRSRAAPTSGPFSNRESMAPEVKIPTPAPTTAPTAVPTPGTGTNVPTTAPVAAPAAIGGRKPPPPRPPRLHRILAGGDVVADAGQRHRAAHLDRQHLAGPGRALGALDHAVG